MKHWPECWRYASHHACAVAEVERLRAELGECEKKTRKFDLAVQAIRKTQEVLLRRTEEEEED